MGKTPMLEGRFASIRRQRQLPGQAAISALNALDLSAAPKWLDYEIRPASTEAFALVSTFNWAMSPETEVGLSDRFLYQVVMQHYLSGEQWRQGDPGRSGLLLRRRPAMSPFAPLIATHIWSLSASSPKCRA